VTRAHAGLLLAVVIALVVGHLVRDSLGYAIRAADGSYEGDIVHYVYWTRLVTLGGIQSAYGGQWPETYAVYPPLTLYPYQIVGNLYRWLEDPTFDVQRAQESLWLREAIKLVALTWHLLTGAAIYLLGRRGAGRNMAAAASALYVANPAALYDTAHWAQPDGAHSLFTVLAIGILGTGRVSWAWAAMALAALSKPQAWSVLPLLSIATVRLQGLGGLVIGVLAGGAVSAVVVAPFVLSGRLGELLSLPGTVTSVLPVVSADAHNLWWIVGALRGFDPLFTPDQGRFIGPLSFRSVALVLVAAQFVLGYWLYWTRRIGLAEAAALGALGWFVCTTQAHENHLFFALPLLALAWPTRRSLLGVFGVLSVTVLSNMALHDQLFLEALGWDLNDPLVVGLRLVNATTNVLCLVGWSLARITSQNDAVRDIPPGRQEPQSHPVGRRAQLQRTS
jgi:Gpi18-like mannosyltransferase